MREICAVIFLLFLASYTSLHLCTPALHAWLPALGDVLHAVEAVHDQAHLGQVVARLAWAGSGLGLELGLELGFSVRSLLGLPGQGQG